MTISPFDGQEQFVKDSIIIIMLGLEPWWISNVYLKLLSSAEVSSTFMKRP